MISKYIEDAVLAIGADAFTEIFVMAILIVFVIGLLLKLVDKAHAFTQYVPTLLTTLGILGTFVGIVAGLLAFDVDDIDGSIAGLLAGMKTAFITSLAGMSTSILYKIVNSLGWVAPRKKDAVDVDQVGVVELYEVMVEQRDGLLALRESIGGGDESSLTGQMKLLRSDINDHHRKSQETYEAFQERLWIKLQEFADMMSKSATEQVIDALKEVIADFNTNLTEQFGENFQQLNEAVLKLVEWQERYKQQVEQMIEQYTQGVAAISQTEQSVATISAESKRIPESMDALRSVLLTNQHQIDELNRHLEAFTNIRDRAVEAVPEIRSQIDLTLQGVQQASQEISSGMQVAGEQLQTSIIQGAQDFENSSLRVNESLQQSSDAVRQNSDQVTQQFSDFLTDVNEKIRSMLAEIDEGNRSLSSHFQQAGEAVTTEMAQSRETFEQGMRDVQQQFVQHLETMTTEQASEFSRLLNGMQRTAEDALTSTGESVRRQVEALDSAREREMEQIAQQMGSALASISGQFTQDYVQLVQAMRRITEA